MNVLPSIVARRRTVCARGIGSLLAALCAGLTGCHSQDSLPHLQVYKVKGKVLLSDGTPLREGWIYFVPKGNLSVTPNAQIASDGTFSVVTGGSGEGAPAGDYKIRVETPGFLAKTRSKKTPFPFKYTDEDSSRIEVTVRPEPNQLPPIQLK
jgi:hypothetical protein